MATVEQVAKAALNRIMVQGSEAPLEADEYADFIFALNNYMAQLAAEGINLGYTEVNTIQDEVTIPTGALRGLIANMAVEVSSDYGGVISEALVVAARQGKQTMRLIGQKISKTRYPSTLPRGQGNYDSFSMGDNFYPEAESTILSETTGAIGLEVNT
jgi:hypothetical protein